MLWVDDVRATIDYYVSTLGFDEENYSEDWDFGIVGKHKVKIMLSKPNDHEPYEKPQLTGSLYIVTDDVDAWWNYLKERASIYYPVEDFPYGMREFALKDCNGYVLQFGQEI